MRLVLHPKVHSDVSKIMEHYEAVATPELADDFYRELRHFIKEAVRRPESFAVRVRDVRRVNLQRFPYHFCFGSSVIVSESWLSAIVLLLGSVADELF